MITACPEDPNGRRVVMAILAFRCCSAATAVTPWSSRRIRGRFTAERVVGVWNNKAVAR